MSNNTDPKKELRELLNDWSGKIKNHFAIDALIKKVKVQNWVEVDSEERYRIEVSFEFKGVNHLMFLEIDKTSEEMDGQIISELSFVKIVEMVFSPSDIEDWVFNKCQIIRF